MPEAQIGSHHLINYRKVLKLFEITLTSDANVDLYFASRYMCSKYSILDIQSMFVGLRKLGKAISFIPIEL